MHAMLRTIVLLVALAGCKRTPLASDASDASSSDVPPIASDAAVVDASASVDASADDLAFAALRGAETIAGALAASKGIKDSGDGGVSVSRQSLALAHWSRKHLAWADVSVKESETSFGMAMKDVGASRGKRICASGRVDYIRMVDPEAKIAVAQITTTAGHYVLYTWLSTGSVVVGSVAKFCGIVIDQTQWAETLAVVDLLGAFDLPENRK